jgi:hypothetical protein
VEVLTKIDRRRFASAAGLVAGLMALGYAVFAQGGFYPRQFRGLVVFLALGAIAGLVAVPPRRQDFVHPLVALSGLLLAWSVCSALAAGSLRGAAPVAGLLVCIAALALIVGRLIPADRSVLEAGILALGVVAGLDGWYGVAWHHRPAALTDQGLWRAVSPITYSNGTAGLLVPLALFSLARAIDGRPVKVEERVVRCVTTYLLLCGAAATLSRAGGIALVAGLVVLTIFGDTGRLARTGGPILIASAISVAGLLPSTPDRSRAHPALALVCLAVGGALVALLVLSSAMLGRAGGQTGGRATGHAAGWARGRTVVVVATVAVVGIGAVLVGTLVATRHAELSRAMRQIRSVRLTVNSTDRVDEWNATWRLIKDRPVLGVGPGQFLLVYTKRGATLTDRYAHNEYLQLFAEEGAVGLILLAGGLVLLVAGLVRAWRQHRPEAAGALAALGALGVHSAFDFLWHIPAVVLLPVAVICLALTPEPRPACESCE